MATLSGDLGDLVGGDLVFPNGQPARAFLVPEAAYTIVDDELRIGGVELTLDEDGAFSQSGVPEGDHQVLVLYFDPDKRQPASVTIPASVTGDTVLSA